MSIHSLITRNWVTSSAEARFDSQMDVSDVWVEECDPHAEHNAIVTAYFDHADGFSDVIGSLRVLPWTTPVLHEIHVQRAGYMAIYNVGNVPFSPDTIERIENAQAEKVNQ